MHSCVQIEVFGILELLSLPYICIKEAMLTFSTLHFKLPEILRSQQ
jgi:hypothetical protein